MDRPYGVGQGKSSSRTRSRQSVNFNLFNYFTSSARYKRFHPFDFPSETCVILSKPSLKESDTVRYAWFNSHVKSEFVDCKCLCYKQFMAASVISFVLFGISLLLISVTLVRLCRRQSIMFDSPEPVPENNAQTGENSL